MEKTYTINIYKNGKLDNKLSHQTIESIEDLKERQKDTDYTLSIAFEDTNCIND